MRAFDGVETSTLVAIGRETALSGKREAAWVTVPCACIQGIVINSNAFNSRPSAVGLARRQAQAGRQAGVVNCEYSGRL